MNNDIYLLRKKRKPECHRRRRSGTHNNIITISKPTNIFTSFGGEGHQVN